MYLKSTIFRLRQKWGLATWTVPNSLHESDKTWWRVVVIGPLIIQIPCHEKYNF